MRQGLLVPAAIAAAMIGGCAAPTTRPVPVSAQATDAEALKQAELAVEDLVDKHKRIRRVHRTLVTRAHALCGEQVGPEVGLYALTRPLGTFGSVLERNYGIREQLTILFVLEGGAADAAGLKARDVIRKVNGTPAPDAKAMEELLDKLPAEAPIAFELERAGALLALTVKPERACRYPVLISSSQAINALADGKRILVTRGMVGFAGEDRELALVIAHEMAHNAMRHIEARKQNASAGLLADFAIALLSRGQVASRMSQAAAMAYSQEFEAEADYVGLYILANAGYPIEGAPLFWRRMAAAHPASIRSNHAASHPSTAYRMVALEGAVREIQAKRAANEPLRPNMKDGKIAPSREPGAEAPATTTAGSAASAPVALAAPGAALAPSAPPAPGLPAVGTTWSYAFADRIYGLSKSLTVSVLRTAGELVEERVLAGAAGARAAAAPRAVDAHSTRFLESPAGAQAQFVEFAPYFLAAKGESAAAGPIDAVGYPVGAGNPGWIVRMTGAPSWEQITVPAGTFRALRLEFEGRRERLSVSPIAVRFLLRVWYAPEVKRYVRLEQKEWLRARQSGDVVVELTRFSPPG